MTPVVDWLWSLVGVDAAERRATEERFRKSLKDYDDADANLDDILTNLKSINKRANRQAALNKTLMPFSVKQGTSSGVETG